MNEQVSKTQRKKQAEALQKLGLELVELSISRLNSLSLPDNLYQAVINAKTIKSHGAKRRQAQLIGKLMRSADFVAIQLAYQQLLDDDSAITASFHKIEVWRNKLIAGDKEALGEFIDLYPIEDIQRLQQLIKRAVNERSLEKNTGAAKALFRYLRLYIK